MDSSEEAELHPLDFADQIDIWLHKAIIFAKSLNVQSIVTELEVLSVRLAIPSFRIVFVGEFGRGKSKLINRLLNLPLLSEGAPPTTINITSILAGPNEKKEIFSFNDNFEVQFLFNDYKNELTLYNQGIENQKVFPRIQYTLDHSWLHEIDAELIDTPGMGNTHDYLSLEVSELLSQCDAVVLVVSAVAGFSLTEKRFLEQEILGRHIPRVAVVVSMLDTYLLDNRAKVFKAVSERIKHISKSISVLPAHPVDVSISDDEVLEKVRSQIKVLSSSVERRIWRNQQVASIIADCLHQLIEFGENIILSEKMDLAKREEALLKIDNEERQAASEWEMINLKLDRRRLNIEYKFKQALRFAKDNLVEKLFFNLSKSKSPKSWWEIDLPFYLHQEFLVLAQTFESFLIDTLAKDLKWLQEEITTKFNISLDEIEEDIDVPLEITSHSQKISLKDIEKYRLYLRVGSSAATISAYLLLSPLAGAISIITDFIGEFVFDKKIEVQRHKLKQDLERVVEKSIEEYSNRVSFHLQKLYHKLSHDMKRKQMIWQETIHAAIENGGGVSDENAWQRLVDEASALRNDIIVSLKVSKS